MSQAYGSSSPLTRKVNPLAFHAGYWTTPLFFGLYFTASYPHVVTPIIITRAFPRLGCLVPSTGPTATRRPSQAAYLKPKLRRHSHLSHRHQPTSEYISVHAGFQVRFTVRPWRRPAVTHLIHSPSLTRPRRRGVQLSTKPIGNCSSSLLCRLTCDHTPSPKCPDTNRLSTMH